MTAIIALGKLADMRAIEPLKSAYQKEFVFNAEINSSIIKLGSSPCTYKGC